MVCGLEAAVMPGPGSASVRGCCGHMHAAVTVTSAGSTLAVSATVTSSLVTTEEGGDSMQAALSMGLGQVRPLPGASLSRAGTSRPAPWLCPFTQRRPGPRGGYPPLWGALGCPAQAQPASWSRTSCRGPGSPGHTDLPLAAPGDSLGLLGLQPLTERACRQQGLEGSLCLCSCF